MKIALTQACLKVKCYFCFSIVADNVILATDTTKTKFWRKFFGRLFSKRCGTVAVLRSLWAILNPQWLLLQVSLSYQPLADTNPIDVWAGGGWG